MDAKFIGRLIDYLVNPAVKKKNFGVIMTLINECMELVGNDNDIFQFLKDNVCKKLKATSYDISDSRPKEGSDDQKMMLDLEQAFNDI